MTTVYNRDPLLVLGNPVTLIGDTEHDGSELEKLHRSIQADLPQLRKPRSSHDDRYMVNVYVPDPEDETERQKLFSEIESKLKTLGSPLGIEWRISSRDDPQDCQVIDSESRDHSDMLHDLGAKGRQSYYESMRSSYSCYFTAVIGSRNAMHKECA